MDMDDVFYLVEHRDEDIGRFLEKRYNTQKDAEIAALLMGREKNIETGYVYDYEIVHRVAYLSTRFYDVKKDK